LHSFLSIKSGLRGPFPLACAVGRAATLAVNAAPVVNQWRHRVCILHPLLRPSTMLDMS